MTTSLACGRPQAPRWERPNAGPVRSAGAASLGVALGGPAIYHGQLEDRPILGEGRPAQAGDIERALGLMRRSVGRWLALFIVGGILSA